MTPEFMPDLDGLSLVRGERIIEDFNLTEGFHDATLISLALNTRDQTVTLTFEVDPDSISGIDERGFEARISMNNVTRFSLSNSATLDSRFSDYRFPVNALTDYIELRKQQGGSLRLIVQGIYAWCVDVEAGSIDYRRIAISSVGLTDL